MPTKITDVPKGPILLNDALNPYEGLDEGFGCEDSDSDIARIGQETFRQQEFVMALTCVLNGSLRPETFSHQDYINIHRILTQRGVAPNDLVHIVSDGGENLRQTLFSGLETGRMVFQQIASCVPPIVALEDAMRQKLQGMDRQQNEVAAGLVDCPENGVVVEVGAGRNYERIQALNTHTVERGGRLICQDCLPAQGHIFKQHQEEFSELGLKNVPYLVLPTSPDFLRSCFEGLDRPKVISMNNGLSKMAFGQIFDFAQLMGAIGCDRAVIGQSVGVSPNSNMLPQNIRPGTNEFGSYITSEIGKAWDHIVKELGSQEEADYLPYLLLQKTQYIVHMVTMEMARVMLQQYAKREAGLNASKTYYAEHEKDIDMSDGIPLVASLNEPTALELVIMGKVNQISMGPFSVHLGYSDKVPMGKLSVISGHYEIVMAKDEGGLRTPASNSCARLLEMSADEVVTPLAYRTSDITLDHSSIYSQFRARGKRCPFESLGEIPTNLIALSQHFGAFLAVKLMFNVWGEQGNHPVFKSADQGGIGIRMQEAFADPFMT